MMSDQINEQKQDVLQALPSGTESAPEPPPQEGLKEQASDTGRTIIAAIIIAVIIRVFLFEPFNIPSSSMVPGLLVGDYLFVSKYAYGYSARSTLMGSLPLRGRLFGKEPERGDVVVFKLPRDNSTDYIKRLVGLPGDRLQMRHGILYVNGQPMARTKLDEPTEMAYLTPDEEAVDYVEHFPNGHDHIIRKEGDENRLDNTPVFIVPEHHYFFMGDNRDNSLDSRTTNVGFVPEENLVGRAEILFFSVDNAALNDPDKSWLDVIRWDRLFKRIN